MADTKQTDSKGRFVKGNTIAKDKGVDFGSMPENRHDGSWKKEESARYKLELIIQMSDDELDQLVKDNEAAAFDKRLAIAVMSGQWRELEGMINQVYGKPQERVEHSNPDGNLMPTIRIVDERNKA